MMMTAEDVGRLKTGLEREERIYLDLRDLSRRQGEIIEHEEGVEALLEVLGRKQVLISEIETIEDEVSPIKQAWEETRETHGQRVRREIEERVTRLQAVLAELLELEDKARTLLQRQQHELAGEIRKISRSREAHQAYGGGRDKPTSTGLIDSRC